MFDSVNTDALAVTTDALELNLSVDEGKKGIIRTAADILACMDVGASLTDEDVTGGNKLAVASLQTETLGLGITAVLG